MNAEDIIKRPILTEKSLAEVSKNRFAFVVVKSATSGQVRESIEHLFNVKVKTIRLLNIPGKPKRSGRKIGHTKGYKKAIVELSKGKIDLFNIK